MGRNHGIVRICLVCGDVACGINFNAVSCMSCKTFFRRNALSQKEVKCQFGDSCCVDRIKRKFCTKCRLKKCFEAGMKKEMIKSAYEKHKLQEKIQLNRIKRYEQVQNKKKSKPQNEKLDCIPRTNNNLLGPISRLTLTPTSKSLSTSLTSSAITSNFFSPMTSLVGIDNNSTQPELESNTECLETFESLKVLGSSLDDTCNLHDISPIDLSNIEEMPFESEMKLHFFLNKTNYQVFLKVMKVCEEGEE